MPKTKIMPAEIVEIAAVEADPDTKAVELDEDERELRALRLDTPDGGGGATGVGIVSISAGKIPRREFFRTHPDIRYLVPMVDHAVGMDTEYYVVAPNMIEQLASIDIET